MSLKTIIVLSIFAGLIVVYVMYMAGEMSKSAAKIEAFQEATDALKATKKPSKADAAPTEEEAATMALPKPQTMPTPPRPTTLAPAITTGAATTIGAATTTKAPAPTPLMRRDFEKSLFIANRYEEIYGTKIGPEDLETLMATFADVEDYDVITYKMKEMKYKGTDEIDTIFQLVDVSERLNTIVNKLRMRAGRLQGTQAPPKPQTPSTTVAPAMVPPTSLTTPAPLTPAPTMPLAPLATTTTQGIEPFSNARKYSVV